MGPHLYRPSWAIPCALLAAAIFLAPVAAMAQIEDIVVTARKRTENLQDVPLAIDAITTEQIERQGITDLYDITKLTPSVQFDQSYSPEDTRITIRGLSNTRGRSNVAFLVDGIDVTTENLIVAGSGLLANQRLLNDVERVEIVKGPQSALYGRAAFSGAISYVTKEPGDELEGQVRVEGAEDGYLQLDGSYGGPVPGFEDILGLRATGVYWTDDGHYVNSVSGENVGGGEGYGGALTGVFTPSDTIKFKARVEYSDNEADPLPIIRVGGGTQGRNLRLLEYPEELLTTPDPETGEPPVLGGGSATTTGALNFGQYCPDELKDPSRGPGFCAASTFGETEGRQVTHSEDPFTGEDYVGVDSELFRGTLVASIDFDFGTFTSYTGWTDYDATSLLDQDYQAVGRPDQLKAAQDTRYQFNTNQFSQELRFGSDFDGPVNFTVGGLYWEEDRELLDLGGFIISCLEFGKDTSVDPPLVWPDTFVPGICDGTNGSVTTWQDYAIDLLPCEYDPETGLPIPDPATGTCRQTASTVVPWVADTEHWSVYASIDWNFSENWTITIEDRYVNETFTLVRPNFSSCANLGFAFGTVPFNPLTAEIDNVTDAADDVACVSEFVLNPFLPPPTPDATGNDWFLIEGSESSSFHTPKVTVEWAPTDDALLYFFWAAAQKPGGLNQLAAGATATTVEQLRFDPEKLDAWELGAKTTWEAAGALQANTAVFFQDYTDKQISTQLLVDGISTPVVINASAAEVWGFELDLLWQPSFVEGLTLSGSYTYLDAEYTDFFDETTSILRIAAAGECPVVYTGGAGPDPDDKTDPANLEPKCRIDLSGNQLERTPENSFVGTVSLQRPLAGSQFDWLVEMNAAYQDERWVDQDNFVAFDDYWLVDARAGLTAESWEVIVYVTNLLDDDTIKTGGTGPDFSQQVTELGFTAGLGVNQFFGALAEPRIFGARLTVRF